MAKMIPYDDLTGLRGTCTKNGVGYENNISYLVFVGPTWARVLFLDECCSKQYSVVCFSRIIWVEKNIL